MLVPCQAKSQDGAHDGTEKMAFAPSFSVALRLLPSDRRPRAFETAEEEMFREEFATYRGGQATCRPPQLSVRRSDCRERALYGSGCRHPQCDRFQRPWAWIS